MQRTGMSVQLTFVILMLAIVLSACSPARSAPPSTPKPTSTPTPPPTNTPAPTRTFRPADNGWDYVALGDSNPGGFGVSHPYVDIYADYMAKDLGVEVRAHNWAFNGAKTAQLLAKLRKDSQLQQDIHDAEVVTIDIGANDWTAVLRTYPAQKCGGVDNQDCLRELIQSYREYFAAILTEIIKLRGEDAKILIRTVDLYMSNCDYSKIYGGDLQVFHGIKPYLDEFNADIEQTTQAHHGQVVPTYLVFNGPDGTQNPAEYLQDDQCHLNARGHRKVADILRELGYED